MSYTEKGHASSCGVMFRPDKVCTCAVGEVERLRAVIEDMMPEGHYGAERDDARCSPVCGDNTFSDHVHRPDLAGDICNAAPSIHERDFICYRCIGVEALS